MNTNVSGKQSIMRKMCSSVYFVGLLALDLFRVFFEEIFSFPEQRQTPGFPYPRSEPITLKRIQGTEVRLTEVYRQLNS
jgi:hypothetical protein